MPSGALYIKPWSPEHYSRTSKVSRNGGCAMHGVDVCRQPATVTVVFPTENNAACNDWVREHPEIERRADDPSSAGASALALDWGRGAAIVRLRRSYWT